MTKCELCKSDARIYCESDQARLCWCCDAKVHSANFLVARHSRCLLCFLCRSPTPWNASGEKLGRTVSICERCVNGVKDGKGESEESAVGNDEDGEIQVVPPPLSCSSSEESSSRFCNGGEEISSKRSFQYPVPSDLNSNDNYCCSSSLRSKSKPAVLSPTTGDGESECSGSVSSRPLKIRKLEFQKEKKNRKMISRTPATVKSVAGEDRVSN